MSRHREGDPEEMDATPMRRTGPSNSRSNGPWWTRWGLLGVVVLALLAVVTGIVPSAVTETKKAVEQTQEDLRAHARKQEETVTDAKRAAEDQVRLLRLLCVSMAKSDDARDRCLR